jgi:ribose 5-phosphate isomerase B
LETRERSVEAPVKIALGYDQAGVVLREAILEEARAAGVDVRDLCDEPALDYPDAADQVARAVNSGEAQLGILACGTGIGMSIAANKIQGIRAAAVSDPYSARMSREHNDANVLCMGGRVIGSALAGEIVRAWLQADPSREERHERRRTKVDQLYGQSC